MNKPVLGSRLTALQRELGELALLAAEQDGVVRLLAQAGRSLRQADSIEQWALILAESAGKLAQSAFYRLDTAPEMANAPAFRQLIDTRETVVCLRAASQVTAPVAELFTGKRLHLFPLLGKSRVLGAVVVGGDSVPAHAFEILLSMAAASLDAREQAKTANNSLISVAPAITPALSANQETEASAADARVHRIVSSWVAAWILEWPRKIAEGRARKNLYEVLREPIEAARSHYAAQFLISGGPDLLHREILTVLAKGDAALLGPAYPGPQTS